jgi:hypothetical protein
MIRATPNPVFRRYANDTRRAVRGTFSDHRIFLQQPIPMGYIQFALRWELLIGLRKNWTRNRTLGETWE